MPAFKDIDVENLLRSYKGLKAKMEINHEKLYGLIPSCTSSSDGMPKAIGGISRQTEQFGIRSATIKDYLTSSVADAKDYVQIIDDLYGALSSECRFFVKNHYFERNKACETKKILDINDKAYTRLRREVLDECKLMLMDARIKPTNMAI